MRFLGFVLSLVLSSPAFAAVERCMIKEPSGANPVFANFKNVNDEVGKRGRVFKVAEQKTQYLALTPVVIQAVITREAGPTLGMKFIDLYINKARVKTVQAEVKPGSKEMPLTLNYWYQNRSITCFF